MTAPLLASQLNGREIGSEITREEERIAKVAVSVIADGLRERGTA